MLQVSLGPEIADLERFLGILEEEHDYKTRQLLEEAGIYY